MFPVLFTAFGLSFTSWPPFALVGIWAFFFKARAGFRSHSIPDRRIHLYALTCVVVFFAGAHLGQLLTVGEPAVSSGQIRFSGLVLYGGVLAAMIPGIALWYFWGWHRRFSIRVLWDLMAPGMIWALFFGRLGCTFYGCCYGSPSGSFPGAPLNFEHWDFAALPFPMELKGVPLHPATLYEAVLLLALAGIGERANRKWTWPAGVLGWSLLGSYALGRFFLEFIRLDPRGEPRLGLSPSQWISAVIVPSAAFFIVHNFRTNSGERPCPR